MPSSEGDIMYLVIVIVVRSCPSSKYREGS